MSRVHKSRYLQVPLSVGRDGGAFDKTGKTVVACLIFPSILLHHFDFTGGILLRRRLLKKYAECVTGQGSRGVCVCVCAHLFPPVQVFPKMNNQKFKFKVIG